MRHRQLAALFAAMTAIAAVLVLALTSHDDAPAQPLAEAPTAIPQLPEHNPPVIDNADVEALQRCITGGECSLVHTRAFSNATVEVYQQNTTPPAVHVQTISADSTPTVWSLKDEHSASFKAMTCGLANCLLDVVVSPELLATIDMRMVSQSLTGKIDGAAVGPALQTLAMDLNNDGVLDLITTGHVVASDGTEMTYYRTYINENRSLTKTGCTIPEVDPKQPTDIQNRTCPA